MVDYQKLKNSRQIQLVALVALLSIAWLFLRDANPATFDANLGIEFVGGVRIPVTLDRNVDQETMQLIVDTVKQRINKFGLSQAVVRPVGDREVLVEIPRADDKAIANVQRLLREAGRFEAIIDGNVALQGNDVITASVGGTSERVYANEGGYSWEIGFTATTEGGKRFAAAAAGKPNYPVYMFLDRPTNAVIVLDKGILNSTTNPLALETAMRNALAKQGDEITIVFEDDVSAAALSNKTEAVVSETLQKRKPAAFAVISKAGFSGENSSKKLVLRSDGDMRPQTYVTNIAETVANQWPAVGLISGPTLSPSLADGRPQSLPSYLITGGARGATPDEQRSNAVSELKIMKIVLTQGKLPVSTVIGSTYSVSASLGKQFLIYSAVGILLSIGIVAALIIIRYRKLVLAVPIVIINAIEMLITLAVVSSFTLDLAAMAGVITLIGTGVDDQIIITDELLRKKKKGETEVVEEIGVKQKIGRAFEIIMTNATVAIVAMLPLLLSGIVEITGFALSYIIGVLVGVFITRRAYGVMVGELTEKS